MIIWFGYSVPALLKVDAPANDWSKLLLAGKAPERILWLHSVL